MRWTKPNLGDERIITIFALFPITLNNETRWLEKCTIKQRYEERYNVSRDVILGDLVEVAWVDKYFID